MRREVLVRVCRHLFEQSLQMAQHPGDRPRLEQIGAVLQARRQTLRDLAHVQSEIELGRPRPPGEASEGDARQPQRCAGRVLKGEHHLKDRISVVTSPRLQFLDQALERKVLVVVRLERHLAHPAKELSEAGISRQIGAQGQRVDEKPDQAFELTAGAVRDGRADDNVVLPGVARQEELEAGQQGHEQRCPLLLAEPHQPFQQRAREQPPFGGSPVAPRLRARKVGGQLQDRRCAGQLGAPVGELPVEAPPR